MRMGQSIGLTDQRLVTELRSRGWTVTCTKTVEKIVYEEVTL